MSEDKGCDVSEDDARWAMRATVLGMEVCKHNTIDLCKRAIRDGIPGDFVEAGVCGGGQPAVMAYVSEKYGESKRKVHLFDSFDGLPMAGPDDTEFDQQTLGVNPDRANGIRSDRLVAKRWQVELNMKKWEVNESLLEYHVGWLQNVLPVDAPKMGPIAVLRVDVDLYDSTVPVFEYLYPLVSSGGYIISDDWGEAGAIPARFAVLKYFDKMGLPAPQVTRIPLIGSTVWWRKP
jgi:Macrocin-O-methyltransferase (TylF)